MIGLTFYGVGLGIYLSLQMCIIYGLDLI